MCSLDETLKSLGPFYLVSMSGEVKDPTQGGGMSLFRSAGIDIQFVQLLKYTYR